MVEDYSVNYGTGWIKLFRSVRNHWTWSKDKKLSYFEAWITILLEVNHESEKVLIDNELLSCERGQKLYSIQSWAKLFNWSVQNVRTFFKQLEKDKMINYEGLRKTTRLTVCNYANYQDSQRADNEQITSSQRTANEQLTTIKEVKNEKNNIYIDFDDFLIRFNYATGKKFRVVDKKSQGQISARIKEGFSIEDILIASVNCSKDKYHVENPKYLTPEFITRADKLQRFLNMGESEKTPEWKLNFESYTKECQDIFNTLSKDKSFISMLEDSYPTKDIPKGLREAFGYYSAPSAWEKLKSGTANFLNWKSMISSSIGMNKIFKTK